MIVVVIVTALALGVGLADNSLSVAQPQSLREQFSFQDVKGAIEERPSLFGVPAYGRSMRGQLILPPEQNKEGCSAFEFPSPKDGRSDEMVFLLWRGSCTFAIKVRNAQDAGATAVVMINTKDEVPTHMSIDGSESAIFIPSMIIKKSDGEKLVAHLEKESHEPVQVSIEYGLTKSDVVTVDVWTSSLDSKCTGFTDFGNMLVPLQEQKKVVVNLHYVFVDGSQYQCDKGTQLCGNQCTNNGKYCAFDPDRDLSTGISGADVVQENLRRICISKYANDNSNYQLPWTYAKNFADTCASVNNINEACSKSVLNAIKGNLFSDIQTCVEKSGGASPTSSSTNQLIDSEIQLKKENNIYLVPSIAFNNAPYYGTTACRSPLSMESCPLGKTLCNAYSEDSVPNFCRTSPGCSLGQVRDACNHCKDPTSSDFISDANKCLVKGGGVSVGTVIGLIVVFVAILVGAAFVYHQHSAVKMRNELRSIMSQYVPLDGDDIAAADAEHTRLV